MMNDDIRELLISEIAKYDGYGSLFLKAYKNDCTLYEVLNDDLKIKKILIN